MPPEGYPYCAASSAPTQFVHTSHNKTKCPVNVVLWTPDGRRAMTGAQTGELTLWSGANFGFETIYQLHEAALRSVTYTHDGAFVLSSDDAGAVKVCKSNLAPLKQVAAHREAVRSVSVAPTDLKFVTASDDSTLTVWDLATCSAECSMSGELVCVVVVCC